MDRVRNVFAPYVRAVCVATPSLIQAGRKLFQWTDDKAFSSNHSTNKRDLDSDLVACSRFFNISQPLALHLSVRPNCGRRRAALMNSGSAQVTAKQSCKEPLDGRLMITNFDFNIKTQLVWYHDFNWLITRNHFTSQQLLTIKSQSSSANTWKVTFVGCDIWQQQFFWLKGELEAFLTTAAQHHDTVLFTLCSRIQVALCNDDAAAADDDDEC